MEFEIEVISQETVKPSSPNPNSRSRYNLSFLDQMAPPVFMPMIYFYRRDDATENSEKIDKLKKSLSQALSLFYPLSGRLVSDGSYVDCSDQGAPFFEAKANCELSRAITDPDPRELDMLLPYKVGELGSIGAAVQVTRFECGGISVGLVVSHKVADAQSFLVFANAWAALARHGPGQNPARKPVFGADSIFPPLEFYPNTRGPQRKESLDTKRFTFKSSEISALRERYSSGPTGPTRVEALSAFLWARIVSSTEAEPNRPGKTYMIYHAVNLRSRLEPPLSSHHFGNISRVAVTLPELRDGGLRLDDGRELSEKVREAIRAVDVAKLRRGEDHLSEMMARTVEGEIVMVGFTSLCRFPLYEADFGWGKPVWVGSSGLGYKNMVTFMDTADGDGIEAWITLRKEDMDKFEADLELNKFTAKDN